ncbi:MAG: hypothetical protein ACE5FU_05695 [Nitrospinota bacterium]
MPKQHPVSCIDSADSPLVFYGPPHRLSGSFRLENASLEKVKLRTLALRSTTLKDSVNSPLTRLQVNSHVGPEERASVPAFMEVDPNTPPGVYDAEFEIGGRFQKIEAHVVETVNLLLQPESITLVAGTEDSFEREILVENAGNIPLALGGECQAPLIRSTDLMTSFREALRKTKGGTQSQNRESAGRIW